jgi:hypothetical protein
LSSLTTPVPPVGGYSMPQLLRNVAANYPFERSHRFASGVCRLHAFWSVRWSQGTAGLSSASPLRRILRDRRRSLAQSPHAHPNRTVGKRDAAVECSSWSMTSPFCARNCDSTSTRATRNHKHLVLVGLASASCRLTFGARDPYAFTSCGCRARRSGRTLSARRSWWSGRSGRTSLPAGPAAPGSLFGPVVPSPQPATQIDSAIATAILFTRMHLCISDARHAGVGF